MDDQCIKVLLIEDNPGDAGLIRKLLAEVGGATFNLEYTDRLSTGLERLAAGGTNVVLLDLGLPDSQGLGTLARVRAQAADVPVVVLTAVDDRTFAMKAVQAGAQDYLVKGQVEGSSLARTLFYAIERFGMQRELERYAQGLQSAEARLRKIIQKDADGIVVVDRGGIIHFVNPAAESLFGYKAEELLGELFGFPLVAGEATELNIVRRGGETAIAEMRVVETEWEGKTAYLTSLHNITKRQRVVEALRESEERFRSIVENSHDGIMILDDAYRFIYVNDELCRMSGYSREEIIGQDFPNFLDEESKQLVVERYIRRQRGEEVPPRYEFNFVRKDGQKRRVEISSSVLRDSAGKVRTVAQILDITERQRAEEAFKLQRAYFQQLFDNSPDAIALLDDADRVINANKGFETLFGYRAEEIKGRLINDIVISEDRIEEASAISRDALNKKVVRKETVRKRKDGSLVDVSILAYPIQFGDKTVGVFAIYCDITERKQAEDALERQKAYFQQLFDNSPDAIAMWDDSGRVVNVNKGFETLFGYQAEEARGRLINDIVIPEDRIEEASALSRGVLNNEVLRKETVRKRKDGSLIDVSLLHFPVQLGGKRVGVYTIYTDITELKRMEQQLLITDRLASVGELAAGIAHELNNPLTSVIGFSQLLLDRDVSDDIKKDIEIVYSEAQRAADVVKNLLTFARKHTPVKQMMNINSIIERVLKLRVYDQRVNNIQVITKFAPDLPETMADYFQLQQVFLNIAINAEYFMTEAHQGGILTITTEKVGDIIKVSFTDDGPGIAKENLVRLFDPFFTTKKIGKGTGLGLSISHGMITEHGGRIYAESELGKGATFIVELPIVIGDNEGSN